MYVNEKGRLMVCMMQDGQCPRTPLDPPWIASSVLNCRFLNVFCYNAINSYTSIIYNLKRVLAPNYYILAPIFNIG